jgi:hypothetical protein
MKALVLVLPVAMALNSLAGFCPKAEEDTAEEPVTVEVEAHPKWPAGKHSFGMFSYHGFAHGCAVNGKTLTNRHVVEVDSEFESVFGPSAMRFRYTFPRGVEGFGSSVAVSNASDAALLKLGTNPPNYAPLATGPPDIGETIIWVEHDFRSEEDAFAIRYRKSAVTQVRAGMVIIEGDVTSGSSGGCAYNGAGEVVGLITWRMTTKDYEHVSGITGLWGQWWEWDDVE